MKCFCSGKNKQLDLFFFILCYPCVTMPGLIKVFDLPYKTIHRRLALLIKKGYIKNHTIPHTNGSYYYATKKGFNEFLPALKPEYQSGFLYVDHYLRFVSSDEKRTINKINETKVRLNFCFPTLLPSRGKNPLHIPYIGFRKELYEIGDVKYDPPRAFDKNTFVPMRLFLPASEKTNLGFVGAYFWVKNKENTVYYFPTVILKKDMQINQDDFDTFCSYCRTFINQYGYEYAIYYGILCFVDFSHIEDYEESIAKMFSTKEDPSYREVEDRSGRIFRFNKKTKPLTCGNFNCVIPLPLEPELDKVINLDLDYNPNEVIDVRGNIFYIYNIANKYSSEKVILCDDFQKYALKKRFDFLDEDCFVFKEE